MSEFRTHHLVARLVDLLRVRDEDPEVYVKILQRNTAQASTLAVVNAARDTVAAAAPNRDAFLKIYSELKDAQVRELDPLVCFLAKVVRDPDVLALLQSARPAILPASRAEADPEIAKLQQQITQLSATMASPTALSWPRPPLSDALPGPLASLERPFAPLAFPPLTRPRVKPGVALGVLPLPAQEASLIEDLLFLMMGVEGKYIATFHGDDRFTVRFEVDPSCDGSLRELAQLFFPLCQAYAAVAAYCDLMCDYKGGLVAQALAAAMRTLVKEFLVFVAQLEHQQRQNALSLQKMWFLVQPCLQTMTTVAGIVHAIHRGRCEGGPLLSLLHERTMTAIGNPSQYELCLALTQAAAAPFLAMLEHWIFRGVIDDAYDEFMISEQQAFHKGRLDTEYNDAYWERHYQVLPDRTPTFLAELSPQILSTGKYLTVVRQCGQEIANPHTTELVYSPGRGCADAVVRAHAFASKHLLELLCGRYRLVDRLTSLKRYFLLEQGDLFQSFMDSVDDELRKNTSDISVSRVASLLELAQRTSQAAEDPFKDDLRCDLLPCNLITELFRIMNVSHDYKGNKRGAMEFFAPSQFQLEGLEALRGTVVSGLEAFTLDYHVEWPVSLVLNKRALKRYQLLFRFLFFIKHVERQLSAAWMELQATRAMGRAHFAYTDVFALQQRMQAFLLSLQYYSSAEVLQPRWQAMMAAVHQASTLDDVLQQHSDFLDTCLKECMLTNPILLKTVSKLLIICTKFTAHVHVVGRSLFASSIQAGGVLTPALIASERAFHETVAKHDSLFAACMQELLEGLSQLASSPGEAQMANLAASLDNNGYYARQPKLHRA